MKHKSIVYLNGEFLHEDEAKVSIFDRGFIFGDGIYEVLPVVDGQLVDKESFWERLVRSLGEIELESPLAKEQYIKMFSQLIEKNSLKEGGIYTQITRGVAPRDFYFVQNLTPTCMAFAFETEVINHPFASKGIKAVSVEDIRWKRRDIKSISLLAQCKAKNDAVKQRAFEGFMIEDGIVTEGTSSTIYIVKDKTIITPPLSNKVLPGIRRKNIIQTVIELGLNLELRHFSLDEVKSADECFISAATLLTLPVIQIDDTLINGGKIGEISKKIREEYVKNIYKEIKNNS